MDNFHEPFLLPGFFKNNEPQIKAHRVTPLEGCPRQLLRHLTSHTHMACAIRGYRCAMPCGAYVCAESRTRRVSALMNAGLMIGYPCSFAP